MSAPTDVLIVGAGIVGLAHALAAVRTGRTVRVVERDHAAVGASIRNFGFITVTGQASGDCWRHARRARDVWVEVAEAAGIPILHEGLLVTARRTEAEAVIDAFLETDMADGCARLSLAEARRICPVLTDNVTAALHSELEVRVESRTAIGQLTRWLAEAHGVDFVFGAEVKAVAAPRVETTAGVFEAETVIVCPGNEALALFDREIAAMGAMPCKLQMLRVAPERPIRLGAAIMSDLGLARYHGYTELEASKALAARLDAEQAEHRAMGVHLIAVQSADGSLVVGDSHEYAPTPEPFRSAAIDDLMLGELDAVVDTGPRRITEQWIGIYPSGKAWLNRAAPDDATRVVVVAAGCGASTAFGIGEETIADLFGTKGANP